MGLGTMSCAFKDSKKFSSASNFQIGIVTQRLVRCKRRQAVTDSDDSDDSEDNSDEDMEQEVVEPGASDASGTDEGSTSDEEGPLVSFKA